MAPAALPLAKLASLFIKTVAKPVSKQVRRQAVKQPLSRRALIAVGQLTNNLSMRLSMRASGYRVRSIAPLEEDAALSRGADMLTETFLFGVSGGIVVYEYKRGQAKEKRKEAERLQKIRDDAVVLQSKLVSLDKRLVALEEYAKVNRGSLLRLGMGANGKYIAPDGVVPILEEKVDSDAVAKNGETEKSPSAEDSPPVQILPNDSNRRRRWWPF